MQPVQFIVSLLLLVIVGSVYCAPQWPGGCGGIGGIGGGGCSQPCTGFGCLGAQPLQIPCGGNPCPIPMPCAGTGCPMMPQPIQQLPQQALCMGCQTQQMTGGCNLCYRSGMPGFCCPPYGGIGSMGSYGAVGGGGIGGMGTQLLGK